MEKVPHKKTKKSLKRPVILLMLLGLALACLGGIWILNATRPELEMPESTEPLYLLSRSGSEIASLAVTPREGAAYTLIRREDQSFSLENEEDVPLRTDAVDSMISSLSRMEAVQIAAHLHEDEAVLSDYGLSPAALQMRITYHDGETVDLIIGGDAPTDYAQYYCMVSGDDHIYTVYADLCASLFNEKAYLRSFSQPELSGDLLDRIDITGDTQLSLYYTPSGWLMDSPYAYPLNTLRTDSLLSRIESMAFESCLGSPEDVDMAALGLEQPALTIILTQAPTILSGLDENGESISVNLPRQQYTLLLGNETGKSGVYLQWEDMVYKASNFLLGFWKELIPEDYLLVTPVNFLINDLQSLSVMTDSVSCTYRVDMVESITENNQIATNEYGETLYDARITKDGENIETDTEAFLGWYTTLSGLTPSGKLPDTYQPEGAPLASIQMQSLSISRKIDLYAFDPFYHAMAVDGVYLYYVESTWLDKINAAP